MPSLLRSCQSVKSNSKATKVSIARLNTLLFQGPSQAFNMPLLWYTSSAYQPLVVPFTVAVKQGIGGISSNPPDPQSEATNTITRSWEPQSWQRRETSAQEHLVSGLRDQIPGFHQITFHLQRIHQTRSFWTLINNLTKHYHLNASQTILRFLLLIASNIELHQSFGFQSRDSSVHNVHSTQCKLSNF